MYNAEHLHYSVLTCLVDLSTWYATAAVIFQLLALVQNTSYNLQLNPNKDMYINKTEL